MHRRRFLAAGRWQHPARATLTLALAAALTGALIEAHAQTAATPTVQDRPTLRAAFEAAWARQPEAQALTARRDAAHAQQQAARSLTPEPVAMELPVAMGAASWGNERPPSQDRPGRAGPRGRGGTGARRTAPAGNVDADPARSTAHSAGPA